MAVVKTLVGIFAWEGVLFAFTFLYTRHCTAAERAAYSAIA
jgi:hypothetical protein